jgi:hypothetical protein
MCEGDAGSGVGRSRRDTETIADDRPVLTRYRSIRVERTGRLPISESGHQESFGGAAQLSAEESFAPISYEARLGWSTTAVVSDRSNPTRQVLRITSRLRGAGCAGAAASQLNWLSRFRSEKQPRRDASRDTLERRDLEHKDDALDKSFFCSPFSLQTEPIARSISSLLR